MRDTDDCNPVVAALHLPPPQQARPDYGSLAPAPDYGKLSYTQPLAPSSRHSSSDSIGSFASPTMMMPAFSPHSSGSGEFLMPPPLPQFGSLPPPVVVQGVAPEIVESIRADVFAQMEQAFNEKCEAYHKKLHLARVRTAELEKRAKRAEADGDDMSARLTLVEVQKAEAEKARDIAEGKLLRMGENTENNRASELEAEVGLLRSNHQEELDSLKNTVMVLANELKRRMKEDGTSQTTGSELDPQHLEPLRKQTDSPEDTDYVTDSRSGSDTE